MAKPARTGGVGPFRDSSILILTSLAGGPKHGYALIGDIAGFSGITVGPGTLYAAIARLEARGQVESLPEVDRRRPYRITPDGLGVLRAHLGDVERVATAGRLRLRGA
jgi:DNA-binding PadR family transcriptional regulator